MIQGIPYLRQATQSITTKFLLLACYLLAPFRRMSHASRNSSLLDETHQAPPAFACIRALYPRLETWHTGGGCLQYVHPCNDDGHLVIRDASGFHIPHAEATDVRVCRFAKNGDPIGPAVTILTSELKQWIDTALDRARNPRSVADYFSKLLGAGVYDDTLCSLGIASACGRDCVEVIDAGARLIAHIRMALGTHGELHRTTGRFKRTPEPEVVEIVRTITRIYSRC